MNFRYRGSITILDTQDSIVIVASISGIAQHYCIYFCSVLIMLLSVLLVIYIYLFIYFSEYSSYYNYCASLFTVVLVIIILLDF